MIHSHGWQINASCWWKVLVPPHMDIYIGLLQYPQDKATGFSQSKWSNRKQRGNCNDFQDLVSKVRAWASLVAQWLRIRLPVQATQVRALVWEDATCRGATKPLCHNYWARALEPSSHNYGACVPQLLKPAHLEPVLPNQKPLQWEAHVPQRWVAPARHN